MFPAPAFGGANSSTPAVANNVSTPFFTTTPFGTTQATFGENGGIGSGHVFGGGNSGAVSGGDDSHSAKRSQTFSKNRSNDADHHRKQREEKANQLRKEKRNEQTMNNRKRPKFDTKESNNEDMTVPMNSNQPVALTGNIPANSNFARLYDVTVWQKKTEQLSSPVRELRLGAMEYLRRILTVDRNPPIDLLLNSCTAIIPSMIRLLKDHSAPEIQFEAAWAITNLACGELQYVQILLQVQMMDHLMEVIMSSKEWMVKDQCLWALFNISTEEEACQYFIQQEHYLIAILGLLGITVEAPNNALLVSTSSNNKPVKKSVVMINPSLSIMRHVAFIFCNIIKMKELQAPYLLKGIFQAFIELLQSPDDEIISDILVTLASSTPQDNHQIQLIQECGIISRLCELVDHSTHMEQALHALASTIQTSDSLQAKSVLYEFHNRHRRVSSESSCAAAMMTGTGCLHVNGHLQQQVERDFLDGVNTSLFDCMVQFLNQHMHRWQQQPSHSQQSSSSNHHDVFLNSYQSPSHVNSIMQSPQVQQYASSSSASSSSSSASSSVSTPFNTQAPVPPAVKDHQGSAKMFKSLQGNILTPVKDIKASQQAVTDMFFTLEQILAYKVPHFLLRRREYENRESMKSLMSMLCNCCRYFMLSHHMGKLNAAASSCFCSLLEVYGQLLVDIDLNALLESMINLIQCHDDRVLHRALIIWQGYLSSPHPLTPPAAFHALKQKLSLLKFYAIPDIVQLAGSLDEQLSRMLMSI